MVVRELAVVPGTADNDGAEIGWTRSSSALFAPTRFKERKRATPTVAIYSTATGAVGKVRNASTGADFNSGQSNVGETGFMVDTNAGSGEYVCYWHWTADAEL